MAGFYPHVGTDVAGAGFTALPTTSSYSLLESIVSDINLAGGTINGWTVYDNMIDSGASYPAGFYAFNNGRLTNATNSSITSWTFTSGSNKMVSDYRYSYNPYNTLSYPWDTGTLPNSASYISVDGTNWYRAVASTWAVMMTATLDRNYAGATTFTRDLQVRCTKYIVLRCTNTTRTFYVMIAQISETAIYFVRIYESWNSTTHTGANFSNTEMIRPNIWNYGYLQGAASKRAQMQYVLCLYSNAMVLWTSAVDYPYPQMIYVGNLDTSGVKSFDEDALWFGSTDTSYSGLLAGRGTLTFYGQPNVYFGSSQCIRSWAGTNWAGCNTYNEGIGGEVLCQVVPRGRTYINNFVSPSLSNKSRIEMCDIDVYNAGANNDNYNPAMALAADTRRGMIRYVKIPVTNPANMNLATTGPSQDGNQYMMLKVNKPITGAGTGIVDGGAASFMTQDSAATNVASSFCQVSGLDGQFADIKVTTSNISLFRYFLVPIQ